jgi:hypothetical protein
MVACGAVAIESCLEGFRIAQRIGSRINHVRIGLVRVGIRRIGKYRIRIR